MIKVENLTKRYGGQSALRGISFEVEQGEILGFLGPNGAGKSTTMNILTGYISATGGRVQINGYDLLEQPNRAKASIGYLPEQPPLYLNMTVWEYLSFVFDLKKVRGDKREQLEQICRTVKLDQVAGRVIGNLSKGYRQRVGLAQALVGNPEVLILDEPTVGLDPQQIIDIRTLIRDLGRQHTIILSSHILTEIQAVCDRIIIISDGRIVADDTEENLSKSISGSGGYTLRAAGEEGELLGLIASAKGVGKAQSLGSREEGTFDFLVEPAGEADVRRTLFEVFSRANIPLLEMRSNELSLEDIFLRLVSGGAQEDAQIQPQDEAEAEPSPGEELPAPHSTEVTNDESNL